MLESQSPSTPMSHAKEIIIENDHSQRNSVSIIRATQLNQSGVFVVVASFLMMKWENLLRRPIHDINMRQLAGNIGVN